MKKAAQPRLKRFLSAVKPKKLLVLCHVNADVDAMACALALSFSLSRSIQTTVGVPDHCNQSAQQLAQKLKGTFVTNPDIFQFDALMVVDCNSPFRCASMEKSLQSFSKPVLVIDHHAKTADTFKTRFAVLDSNALSASQLVLQELQAGGFSIPKKALLALAAGMVSDSADLSLANATVLEKLSYCLQKTDSSIQDVQALYARGETLSERIAKLKSLNRLRVFEYNGFLVAVSHSSFFESQIANALIAAGADIALVVGLEKKSAVCRLACRASFGVLKKSKIDLAKDVCVPLASFLGGQGNGHAGAAGFSVFGAEPEKVLQSSLELLGAFFKKKFRVLESKELI